MAQRRGPTQGLLLQDIILELQISNENVSGIETGVTMLTDSVSSLLSSTEKRDQIIIDNDDRMITVLKTIGRVNTHMLDTMNRLYRFFIDNDMIRAEQHRDLIDAIEDIDGGDTIQQIPTKTEKKSGGLLGLLLAIGGLTSLATMFGGLMTKIKSLGLTSVIFKVFSKIRKIFDTINKHLLKIIKPLSKIISSTPLGKFIGTITKTIGKILRFIKPLSKLLGKLALPITIIMALIESVVGAFKGYETDGVMGAIKGGLKGLLNGLVGWLLDIPKDIISWMLNMFGFENASKWLDSWNFESLFDDLWKMFSGLWDQILSTISGITDWWKSWSFDGIWQGIKDFFFGIWDSVIDWLKSVSGQITDVFGNAADFLNDFYKSLLKAVLPDKNRKQDFGDPLWLLSKLIPDQIYTWANSPSTASTPITTNIQPMPSMVGGNLASAGGGGNIIVVNNNVVDQSGKTVTVVANQGKRSSQPNKPARGGSSIRAGE